MTMILPKAMAAGGRRSMAAQSLAFVPSRSTARRRGIVTTPSNTAQRNTITKTTLRLDSRHPDLLIGSRRGYVGTSPLLRQAESSSSSSNTATLETSDESTTALGWETFEFSTAPKWDARFDEDVTDDDNNIDARTQQHPNDEQQQIQYPIPKKRNAVSNSTMLHTRVTPEEWKQIVQDERVKDEELSRHLQSQHAALRAIDPILVQRAIDILSNVVQPDRLQRISSLLQQRTRNVRFLFENPGNPSNVWACLRTLDSFGIQHVGIIMDPNYYEQGGGKAAIVQKRGMRTAMGSAQWMTVHHYLTTTQAIQHVRDDLGFCIVASDVHEGAHDIRALPWNHLSVSTTTKTTTTTTSSSTTSIDDATTTNNAAPPPICIVMGNEGKGISEEMRQACDATFYLPMSGFAESFNLSVATAITCAHLSAASSATAAANHHHHGPLLRPGDLDPHEYNCLLLKGLLFSFAKKRTGHALLLNEGIVLPPEMNWI